MKQIIKAVKINNKWVLQSPDWQTPLANFSWDTRKEAYWGCKRLYPFGKKIHSGYEVEI